MAANLNSNIDATSGLGCRADAGSPKVGRSSELLIEAILLERWLASGPITNLGLFEVRFAKSWRSMSMKLTESLLAFTISMMSSNKAEYC